MHNYGQKMRGILCSHQFAKIIELHKLHSPEMHCIIKDV